MSASLSYLSTRMNWIADMRVSSSHGGWIVGGRILGLLTVLVGNAVLARILTQDDFAQFSVVISLATFGSGFAAFGLEVLIVRRVTDALTRAAVDRARTCIQALRRSAAMSSLVAGFLSTLLMASIGSTWLEFDRPFLFALLAGIMISLAGFQLVMAEGLRSTNDLRLAGLLTGGRIGGPACGLLFLVLICGASLLGHATAVAAMALNLLALVVTAIVATAGLSSSVRRWRCTDSSTESSGISQREIVSVGIPIVAIRALGYVTQQSDLWIAAGSEASQAEVALYAAAQRVNVLLALPLEICMFLMLTQMVRLHGQGRLGELQSALRRWTTLAAVPTLTAVAVLFAYGDTLFGWYFGAPYAPAGRLIRVLAMGQVVMVSAGLAGYLLVMTGFQRDVLWINLCSAAVLVGLGPVVAARHGLAGLAGVSAASVALQCTGQLLLAKKRCGVWTHVSLAPWRHSNKSDQFVSGDQLQAVSGTRHSEDTAR